MFGDGMQKNELPLIIVCDDKDMVYAQLSNSTYRSEG